MFRFVQSKKPLKGLAVLPVNSEQHLQFMSFMKWKPYAYWNRHAVSVPLKLWIIRPIFTKLRRIYANGKQLKAIYFILTLYAPCIILQRVYKPTRKIHKILVIRLYFLLDALHVSDCISPSSGESFISCTSHLVCAGICRNVGLLCGYSHSTV